MSSSSKKTVYFIRHAESETNAQMKIVVDSFYDLVTFTNFSVENIATFWASLAQLLLDTNEDPALSELGVKQACSVQEYANEEFTDMKSDVTDIRVLFSNLQRAKETARNVLLTHFDEAEEVSLLQEATRYEHVFPSTLLTRIHHFEQWLSTVEESTIVIVGHAQYFKHMLKFSSNIHNCDVWKMTCKFARSDAKSGGESSISTRSMPVAVEWTTPELEFRSPHSYTHPMNMFSFIYKDTSLTAPAFQSTSANRNDGQNNETKEEGEEEEEVTCRICQMTASESTPGDVFIRPCKCSGSLSHVHISCLNEWRATSSSAAYKCFTCQYTYRIERTTLSQFLMSENGTRMISTLLIIVSTIGMGTTGIHLAGRVFSMDICQEICKLAHWPMWWRSCSFYYLPSSLHKFFSFWTHFMFNQDIENIRAIFLCHWLTVLVTEIVLVGCATMGVLGMTLFLIQEGHELYQHFGFGHNDWKSLAFVACWLASLGSTNISRLSIWLGFAVSCRTLYYKIRRIGQKVAQTIGENILEPN